MGYVDQVPRAGNLFIGGLFALQQTSLIKEANITHVVSVMSPLIYAGEIEQFHSFSHLPLDIEDDPNEDLIKHFDVTNKFISEGLETGGGVFVHCAMGKSRSATVVVAYLMWKYHVSVSVALDQLCEGRPVCGPNPGFMEQLDTYHVMLDASSKKEAEEIYQGWLLNRFTGPSWEWETRGKL